VLPKPKEGQETEIEVLVAEADIGQPDKLIDLY